MSLFVEFDQGIELSPLKIYFIFLDHQFLESSFFRDYSFIFTTEYWMLIFSHLVEIFMCQTEQQMSFLNELGFRSFDFEFGICQV